MIATIVIVLILLLILGTLFDGYFIVRTREAAILERLGKFQKVAHAGLHFKMPWVDRVRDKISLQVRQLDVMVETKTKDNVFVQIPVAVQYEGVEGREREAYYMLSNHEQQIVAYVQDNVRSSVANMDLDDSFSSKDTIARMGELATSKEQPADYAKAMSDFASAAAELAAEHISAYAEVAKRVQMDTVDLLMNAGNEAQGDMQRMADTAARNVKDATRKVQDAAAEATNKAKG